ALAFEQCEGGTAAIEAKQVTVVLELVADDGEILDHLIASVRAGFEVDSEVDGRVGRLLDQLRLRDRRPGVEQRLLGAPVGGPWRLRAVLDGAGLAVRAGQGNLKGEAFSLFGFAADLALAGKLERLIVEVLIDRQQAETA